MPSANQSMSMDNFLDVPISPRSLAAAAQKENEERAMLVASKYAAAGVKGAHPGSLPLAETAASCTTARIDGDAAVLCKSNRFPCLGAANLNFVLECTRQDSGADPKDHPDLGGTQRKNTPPLATRRPKSAKIADKLRVQTAFQSPGGSGTFVTDGQSPKLSLSRNQHSGPRCNYSKKNIIHHPTAAVSTAAIKLHDGLRRSLAPPERGELKYGQLHLLGGVGRHFALAENIDLAKSDWACDFGPIDPDLETIPYSRTYLYGLYKSNSPRFAVLCRNHNMHYENY